MTQVQDSTYPETPRRHVSDLFHGETLVEEYYRWLEDSTDPEVRKWVEEQNNFTRVNLEKIPSRGQIQSRLKQLYSKTSSIYYSGDFRGNCAFFMKWDPSKQQPYLVCLDEFLNGNVSEMVVFDPNQYDQSSSTSIDFFVPSKDGKLVAICLSKGGSEDGSLHIFDVATGQKFPDVLPRANYPTAGGSAEWTQDSGGIYYTRYPSVAERPKEDLHFYQQVYFHKVGTDASKDLYVIGKEFPRIAEVGLSSPRRGPGLLATVSNGDGGEYSHYYLDAQGRWTKITDFKDEVKAAKFSPDGKDLFLLSRNGAPAGKMLKLSLASPNLERAKTLFEAREGSIEEEGKTGLYEIGTSKIFVSEVVGGPSKLFVYDHDGSFLGEVSPTRESVCSIDEFVSLEDDALLIMSQSFLTPSTWFKLDSSLCLKKVPLLETKPPIETSSFETIREIAVSKDGTRVPINILLRKGTERNRSNPTILYGYGGYGISLKPRFSIHFLAWLDLGGIFAIANLRGGGEYGEEWHRAGMLTKKQNVFDDFIACAEYLIDRNYTRKEKLAIEGGSNGGLLMGAAITQRPELFQACVSHVGVYDALRSELEDNGAFNTTEFGSVKNPEEFKALYAYSPYHKIVDGTDYPAVLLLAGENDGRVDPWHSRKMAARLQRATRSSKPVLLRIDTAGHGYGTPLDQRIAQDTDVYSFLCRELQHEQH